MRSVGPKMRLIQAEVAQAIRNHLGGVDVLGERELMAQLRRQVISQGFNAERVDVLLVALVTFPRPSDDRRRWTVDVASAEVCEGRERTNKAVIEVDPEPIEAASWLHEEGRLPAGGHGYVVSIERKSGYRRLHLTGRCHRIPGIDYTTFEELGAQMPEPSCYDGVCGQCWRGGRGASLEHGGTAHGGRPASSSGEAVVAAASANARDGATSDASGCSVDDSSSTDA